MYTRAELRKDYTERVPHLKWPILVVLSASLAAGQGTSAVCKDPGFRATAWGMTQAQVLASETAQPSATFQVDHEVVVRYDSVPFSGFRGHLLYFFAGGKLVRAKHMVDLPRDLNQSIGDFKAIDAALQKTHGKPFETKNVWGDDADQEELLNYLEQDRATPADLLVSDRLLGQAIEHGHLKLFTVWIGNRTRILHGIAAERGVVTHQTEYRDGDYKYQWMVDGVGLEPTTPALRTRCSPN